MAFLQLCSLVLLFQVSGCFSQNSMLDRTQVKSQVKILSVGKEVRKEILPLEKGQLTYQINGLKELTWYEVKISYPATVCDTSQFFYSNSEGCFCSNTEIGKEIIEC
eukprot:TRINITY_DN16362_c0_g1_i1.p1 TRINITY_DN16362_c0_g1~~TRINITY_DN16362_c0_g1_i1.p1  ORF type:complete len:107 (+),score=17.49 TRINITY_DN16362_c0_g1_i1:133-453(+)